MPWLPNEGGLELGVPIFCVHKGLPLEGQDATRTSPRDVGPAARMFPEAHIVVYHSGFEHGLSAGESTLPPGDPQLARREHQDKLERSGRA